MKIILRILFILIAFDNVAQLSIHPVIGVSHTASLGMLNNSMVHSGTDVYLGSRVDTKIGSIGLYGTYRFSGSDGSSFGYTIQSHFFGGILEYRILNIQRRFSPYMEISVLSELTSNYQDGYLNTNNYNPQTSPGIYSYSDSHSDPLKYIYYSAFYYSTPLVGNVLLGCDVRLTRKLNIKMGLGYGIRGMKTRWDEWKGTKEITTEQIEALPINTDWFNMLDIKLGLTYKFSMKK